MTDVEGRGAVRGLDRQGRLRGAVAGGRGAPAEIRVPEGETVDVGTVLAVVGDGAGAAARRAQRGGIGARAAARAAAEPAGAGTRPPLRRRDPAPAAAGRGRRARARRRPPPVRSASDEVVGGGDGRVLSPLVRRCIREHGLDPATITGTGPGGRITRGDVLDAAESGAGSARLPLRRPSRRRLRAGSGGRPGRPAPAPAAVPPPLRSR